MTLGKMSGLFAAPQTGTVSRRDAQVPPGMRLYVVGDIHGRADLLCRAISAIEDDIAKDVPAAVRYIFLGDYIDRGPNSSGVLDVLIVLTRHRDVWFLRGNHEFCLIEFLEDRLTLGAWKDLGCMSTLISYGIDPTKPASGSEDHAVRVQLEASIPLVHKVFLRALRPYCICGDYFFVHAGIRPHLSLDQQADADLMWIRKEFLESDTLYEKVIVHGHSPALQPEMKDNRINIDTGAYATGTLTCLRLENDTQSFIKI